MGSPTKQSWGEIWTLSKQYKIKIPKEFDGHSLHTLLPMAPPEAIDLLI
jgi:hypothetical protein